MLLLHSEVSQMLCRIAIRNVKRQLSNYLIYFITVTVTVAMMFALCNLTYSKELLIYAEAISEVKEVLIGISVLVAVIVSFVLGYANSFMLKFRKKEFGTYLTLGMTRRNILTLFIVENLLIGIVAMSIGIMLGLLIFQAMTGIIAKILELDVTFASYSVKGLWMTLCLCGAMFIMATLISARYLRKTSIHELLHSQKNKDRPVKHPIFHFIAGILAIATIVMSLIEINKDIGRMFLEKDSNMGNVLLWLLALLVGVVFFHIAVCKSIMFLLLKCRKIRSNGTNTFVLRQLSSQLGTNSVLCGMLALLITLSVLGTNVSFGEKSMIDDYIKRDYPFDIVVNLTENMDAPFSYEDSLKTIEKYSSIDKEIKYNIYSMENNVLHQCTPWHGANYESLYDSYMKVSDFNRLAKELGYPELMLHDNYVIVANATQVMGCDFSRTELNIDNKTYICNSVTDKYPEFIHRGYFLCIIPDEAVTSMKIQQEYAALDLATDDFDAKSLEKELSYNTSEYGGVNYTRCNYAIKEYALHEENATAALLIICTLYLAIIFVFMAVAILAMKLLSGITEDRSRYSLLGYIGTDYCNRKRTLLRQIFCFFTVPFLLPIILSIPIAYICGQIVSKQGYVSLVTEIYKNSTVIALIMIFTQFLYFSACYYIEKKRVL